MGPGRGHSPPAPAQRCTHTEEGWLSLTANLFVHDALLHEAIPEEHILLYQDDGAFCTQHARSLDSFMHHPWLGSPWNPRVRLYIARHLIKCHLV
jgi:hypothetical protein